ncbi:uncharacterized protein HaLaN_07648 [Haematococcus lacustris]|uniref:Cilia- and flagella-associated protein 300 n=1 Tax=Haematococcus lacustris TaxID=44745 RepID=A0A699YWV5_HAELA|nr:uncharacterized protein HaLaN_07648 [Haematococcus lacustris]
MAFPYVSLPSTSAFNEPFTKSLLEKWDMRKFSKVCVFRYTKYYHRLAGQELLLDLFNDPSSQEHLQQLAQSLWGEGAGGGGGPGAMLSHPHGPVTEPDQGAEPLLVRGPGGELDKIAPYLDTTKKLYKELVTVQRKSGDSDAIEIVSTVFSIKSFKTESGTLALFPRPSRNSFCYVTIDPMRRLVKMWYHAHLPFW